MSPLPIELFTGMAANGAQQRCCQQTMQGSLERQWSGQPAAARCLRRAICCAASLNRAQPERATGTMHGISFTETACKPECGAGVAMPTDALAHASKHGGYQTCAGSLNICHCIHARTIWCSMAELSERCGTNSLFSAYVSACPLPITYAYVCLASRMRRSSLPTKILSCPLPRQVVVP